MANTSPLFRPFELGGLTFKVSKANSRRLVQLQVIRPKPAAEAESAAAD